MSYESSETVDVQKNNKSSETTRKLGLHDRIGKWEDKIKIENEFPISWGFLPVDIQYLILSKLNYKNLCRAKTQAKVFKKLIENEEFHNWRGKTNLREGLLTALNFSGRDGVWQCQGYDLTAKAWKRLPPFRNLPRLDPAVFKEHSICVAGGLICANVGRSQGELIVFNPLTGKQREIPRLEHPRNSVLMHMIVDSTEEEAYKIVVAGSSKAGDDHLSKLTEVFDSRTSVWKVTQDVPGPLYALNEHQAGVCVDGILYCIAFLENARGKGVIAYSVSKEKWLPERTCPLPYSTSSNIAQLVEKNGKVHLFSELEHGRRVEHRIDVLEKVERNSNTEDEAYTWRNVMTETKVGSPGLQTYPEHACVDFGEEKLCIFNTIEHTGIIYDLQSGKRCKSLLDAPARSACGDMGFFSLNPLSFTFEPRFKGARP